jgi:hypothetical protein
MATAIDASTAAAIAAMQDMQVQSTKLSQAQMETQFTLQTNSMKSSDARDAARGGGGG